MPSIAGNGISQNIISLFNRKSWAPKNKSQIIRLSPEIDGLNMLYANTQNEDPIKLKILCWALNKKGDIEALIPWLQKLHICRMLKDTKKGHWLGYFNQQKNHTFIDIPIHKEKELHSAAQYFSQSCNINGIVQEIPDNIGTHALYSTDHFKTIQLRPIISWQLNHTGDIEAMAYQEIYHQMMALPGDDQLTFAQKIDGFQYFLPHLIAKQIESKDTHMQALLTKLTTLWNPVSIN
ncbi:MAG: hypothetical protein HAW62_03315 [Endozoicomonadaceae bacterium]|nr:hypothetical protein [Endozoicomonadaceae bacterium]